MQSSSLVRDLLLLVVVISSMITGILFPHFGSLFQPITMYCLMALFFLSFLSIEFYTVWQTLKSHGRTILGFTVMKSLILPVIVFYIFRTIAPTYALSALLLTGVSTGVVAPFISNLVKGNSPLVLAEVVITSVLVPFTLPALIEVVMAQHVEISLLAMVRMLVLVIFIPIAAVEILRRLIPKQLQLLLKNQFPISLVLFAVMNFGIFSGYADFFTKEPFIIMMASVVAFILSGIYCIVGILFFWKSSMENQLAGAVMLANMNNVLVIVFSSAFFGPVEAMVATMYILPFFGVVIPLRYYSNKRMIAR